MFPFLYAGLSHFQYCICIQCHAYAHTYIHANTHVPLTVFRHLSLSMLHQYPISVVSRTFSTASVSNLTRTYTHHTYTNTHVPLSVFWHLSLSILHLHPISHNIFHQCAYTECICKKGHAVRLRNGIAVCCRVLQCVAEYCSALQCIALYCNALQCIAVCCSVLQIRCCSISLSLHLARSFSHCKKGTARLLLRCSNGACSLQVSFSKRARQLVASLLQVTYRCATIIYI